MKTCHGCPKLRCRPDAAGGGYYYCSDVPGLVLAEWGHWVEDKEELIPLNSCKEREKMISESDRQMVDQLHDLFKQGRFVELFTEAKEWGAAAERERIRGELGELVGHISKLARHNPQKDTERCSKIIGELERCARKKVELMLKDGDGE